MADSDVKIKRPDFYPWTDASPSRERWFDALPVAQQWRLVDEFLAESDEGEPAEFDLDAFLSRMRTKHRENGL